MCSRVLFDAFSRYYTIEFIFNRKKQSLINNLGADSVSDPYHLWINEENSFKFTNIDGPKPVIAQNNIIKRCNYNVINVR